jgi:hypothetical protein
MTNHRTHRSAVLLHLVWLFAVAGAGGCSLATWFGAPPLAWESVRIVAGDRGELHQSRGLYLTLANTSTSAIEWFSIAADLFDADGLPPSSGPARISCAADVAVRPGETCTVIISLDGVAGELVPARIRIERVRSADGAEWRNPGTYVFEGDIT